MLSHFVKPLQIHLQLIFVYSLLKKVDLIKNYKELQCKNMSLDVEAYCHHVPCSCVHWMPKACEIEHLVRFSQALSILPDYSWKIMYNWYIKMSVKIRWTKLEKQILVRDRSFNSLGGGGYCFFEKKIVQQILENK